MCLCTKWGTLFGLEKIIQSQMKGKWREFFPQRMRIKQGPKMCLRVMYFSKNLEAMKVTSSLACAGRCWVNWTDHLWHLGLRFKGTDTQNMVKTLGQQVWKLLTCSIGEYFEPPLAETLFRDCLATKHHKWGSKEATETSPQSGIWGVQAQGAGKLYPMRVHFLIIGKGFSMP